MAIRRVSKPKRQSPQLKALKKALSDDLEGYFRWNAHRARAGDVSAAEEMLTVFAMQSKKAGQFLTRSAVTC